jgi:hypothetical protein
MDTQQMMELLLARQDDNAKTSQQGMLAMNEKMDAHTKATMNETKKAMKTMQENIQENLKKMMEEMMNTSQAKTDAKFKELTETIEKTQMELQTTEVSLDARTRKLQEDLIETKHELQARLEAVETTERGNTPAAGASTAPPPTFNASTSWSVFRRQFESVAGHNRWSNREKSTFLITALKDRAADVLPGIPTNTTNENTLQAQEDRFGDQRFAAAYLCQLTTRTQKAGESLHGH